MADVDLELEGDADDLEGGLGELAAVFSSDNKKSSKPQQSKVHQSYTKNRTFVTSTEQSEKRQALSSSGNKSQSSVTPTSKIPPRKQAESTKKNVNKGTSDVGDIADLIGSLDSDRKKASEMLSKVIAKTDDSKVEAVASVAATRKRKSSVSDSTDSVKAKKANDVQDKCPESVDDKDDVIIIKEENVAAKDYQVVPVGDKTVIVIKDDEKVEQKLPPLLEEDSRIVDNELVEEMMEKVKKGVLPFGDKYIVRFSPVEIGDLADESLQKLILSHPNLVFYFKRQGKFKKKKGYAEVYLFQVQDAVSFIEKLLQLKLLESRIEVSLTMPKLSKDNEVLSFVIWLDKNSKLVKLRNAEGERRALRTLKSSHKDGSKGSPETLREHLQIEKVPASADTQLLRMLFPFAVDVAFSPEQKNVDLEFKGPVNISYVNAGWLEAVLDCCSEHTFSGHPLSIKYTRKKQEPKAKPDPEVKREAVSETERRSSIHEKNGDSGSKTDKDGAKLKSDNLTASSSTAENSNVDEDISNMTRDVCSGMMESLNKLRQLGTDNPNVMKILEMQNELLKLQQTLSKEQSLPPAIVEDPWTVTAADNVVDKQNKQSKGEQEQEKKLPKEQKKKPEKESRTEKQRKEMEDLQRMIDDAEETKRQREERAKRQLEMEMQKIKESEDKRKSGWARRMIEDAKQSPEYVTGENAPSKEEIQRMFKLIENRRKVVEETKKLEETKGLETLKSEQAAGSAGGPEEILKKIGLDYSSAQSSQEMPDPTQFDAAVQEKVIHSDMQATSEEPQIYTEDIKSDVVAWSPDRALHEGVPVYSEEEFSQVCSVHVGGELPWDHYVRITYHTDRRCPVESCPATKYFKTGDSFISHWEVFHTAQMTVKFCQKCNAYFTNVSELETHLMNRHSVNGVETVKKMSQEAREKIVANPSFRDPGRYLPPLV